MDHSAAVEGAIEAIYSISALGQAQAIDELQSMTEASAHICVNRGSNFT